MPYLAQRVTVALRKLAKGPPPGQNAAVTETRIEQIAVTLRNGTFRNGVTLQAFSAQWPLRMDRVHELSAMAARRVRLEVTDPDRVAAKGFAAMEKIADDAMAHADVDEENAAAHRSVALKAYDTWLTKSGVAAPTKVTTTTRDLSGLTDEQLDALEAHARAKAGK